VESAEEARALAEQLVEANGDKPYRVTFRTKKVSEESDGQGWQKTVTTTVTTEITNQAGASSASASASASACDSGCPCTPCPCTPSCSPPPPVNW
jgi:hypothetical protein